MNWVALVMIAGGCVWGQPALPPDERPHVSGTVTRISRADGIALDTGLSAPLAAGLQVEGAAEVEGVTPGDLVDLVRDENGLVTHLRVLPRLTQRVPLVQATTAPVPLAQFWWTHEGQDYPDSVHAADATVGLQVAAVSLEATVAYVSADMADAVEFAVLDGDKAVIWSKRVEAGTTAALRCPLVKGGALTLRCRRADESLPDEAQCVWGSPTLVLREAGLIPLSPGTADDLVTKLADSLRGVDAGAIAIAQPRVYGLSPQIARDLQQDLLVALARKHAVVGLLAWEGDRELTDAQRQQAQAAGAGSVATSELRYAPEGTTVRVVLVHAASGEAIASAETTVRP